MSISKTHNLKCWAVSILLLIILSSIIPNKNYSHSEIFRICGGNLYGVLAKTDNTIVVTYSPYDHKNEPIITEEFVLTDAKNE